ncbi:MAG: N-acetyltransferase family protein, partial [Methyloceanibacter sp.]
FWDGKPAGFALWFYNFSTFHGRHGIYLEDLFVAPELRGKGIGIALIKTLARRCVDEGLTRLQWWVLNWNEPSIAFYKTLGAAPMDEWTVFRVTGDKLRELAQ